MLGLIMQKRIEIEKNISINFKAICGLDMNYLDIVARCHDSRVFQNSKIHKNSIDQLVSLE